MSKISDEIIEDSHSLKSDYTFIQNLLITAAVIIAAIFIGETLFGKNSLEVYLSLEKDKIQFKNKIETLQHKNAALQKDYFELKSLLPEDEKSQ